MERVTLRMPKQQIEEVEQLVNRGKYPSRSEAVRSAVRRMLNDEEARRRGGQGVGRAAYARTDGGRRGFP